MAVNSATQHLLGATWCRQLQAGDPGYGYIADDIPEITLGVDPLWRGQGLGTALLETLIEQAMQRRHRALSLSVEHDNPATRLYTRLGFTVTDSGDTAWTMIRLLPKSP